MTARWMRRKWTTMSSLAPVLRFRGFRSDAALEVIGKAREERVQNLVLYNYPSFSGAFSALFARLFHSRLNLPCLVLPFSSVEPLRVEDVCIEGLERVYLLDFLGPTGFAAELSRRSTCEVIGFDHRKSVLSRVKEGHSKKVSFYVDLEKSSSRAVYEYFSTRLSDTKTPDGNSASLLNPEGQDRLKTVLKYIEAVDLRQCILPDINAFRIGLNEWRSKLNCITNPYIYEQLLELSATDLISNGNSYISDQQSAASKLLDKVFRLQLGRGFYGECLGVRVDGNSHLSDEIGKQLSVKSAAVGLRPIGAVIFMHHNGLKMCLRSADSATDTSEIAKAYGGGGSASSSSFMIRMDEYNQWLSVNTS